MTRLLILLSLVLLTGTANSQRIYNYYRPGDWVSYTDTRYITGIARGFNTIYFASTGGVLRYDKIYRKWLDPLTISDGMPDNRVRRIAVDHLTDEVWIDTPSGASFFSQGFQEWSAITNFPSEKVEPPGPINDNLPQFFTPPGYAFYSGGLITDREMSEYRITQLVEDESNVAWMGIWGLGPARGDLITNDLSIMPHGIYDDDVGDIDADGDEFWILGGGSGIPGTITYYNRSADEWEYFDSRRNRGIVSDQYYTVAHDAKNVWFGTELGLVRMVRSNQSFTSYGTLDGISGERVTAILPIKNNVLIGTDHGVSVFDIKRDSIYDASSSLMESRQVYDFAVRDTIIYAATDIGVMSLVWGGSHWQRVLLKSADLRGYVYDIQIVDSLLYTIGADGVVVVNLKNLDAVTHDRNTVFHNADLVTLLVHEGIMWAGGNDGLFRYNPRKQNWYRYTLNDGLAGMRVSSIAADGDYVWIGTDRGLTRFFWNDFDRSDWLQ